MVNSTTKTNLFELGEIFAANLGSRILYLLFLFCAGRTDFEGL